MARMSRRPSWTTTARFIAVTAAPNPGHVNTWGSVLILPTEVEKERLITNDYRKLQETLHQNPNYGVASTYYAPMVAKVINDHEIQELLDYGAGKGRLSQELVQKRMVDHPLRIQQYDPAVPKWAEVPEPCQMVACIDVLEHIEPRCLEAVLDDLQRVTKDVALFTVATTEAEKFLADGRNAHLIVEGPEFWLPKFMERFDLHAYQKTPDGFLVLLMAREVQ
jgi:hypothetical protein